MLKIKLFQFPLTSIVFWLSFFKIASFVFHRRKSVIGLKQHEDFNYFIIIFRSKL